MLFIAGLWPFNFTERNNVSISPDGGLVIARHGTAYTASSPGKLEGLSQLAVLIDLETSSDGLSAFEKIFSYSISQMQMNFILGQWKDAFLPIVRTDQKVQGIKLGVESALQQGERTKFLLNWDGRRIRLYQDGATRNTRETGATAFSNWSKEYPLIVGTDANGRAQWKGILYEIAVFDRALASGEVRGLYSPSGLSGRNKAGTRDEGVGTNAAERQGKTGVRLPASGFGTKEENPPLSPFTKGGSGKGEIAAGLKPLAMTEKSAAARNDIKKKSRGHPSTGSG